MKIEHTPAYALMFTALWLALSFAYVFGTFITAHGFSGLIRIDDLIIASSGVVCVIVAVVIPLLIVICSAYVRYYPSRLKWGSISTIVLCISIIVAGVCILLYAAGLERDYNFGIWPLMIVMVSAGSIPLNIGAHYDATNNSRIGRATSIVICGCVISFLVGSAQPHVFKEHAK